MRVTIFTGACVLCLASALYAQAPAAPIQPRVTLTIVTATLADAVEAIAKQGGVAVRFDERIASEVRDRRLSKSPVLFSDAPVETALRFLLSREGLTLVDLDAKTFLVQPAK